MPEIPSPNSIAANRQQLVAAFNAKLIREQNLPLAIAAGAGTAVLGALIWMGITITTHYHLGLVAIAIGACVGFAIRYAGKGVTKPFGFVGAIFALVGCVLGEFLATVYLAGDARQMDFFTALSSVDPVGLLGTIFANAGIMTYIIYGIAVWEGYKFSFRKVTMEDLQTAGLTSTPASTQN